MKNSRRIFYGIGVVAALAAVCAVSVSAIGPESVKSGRLPASEISVPDIAAPDLDAVYMSAIDAAIHDSVSAPVRFAARTNPSDVEIRRDDGIGSGVHIGGGLFLTAAHVVRGVKPGGRLDIKLRDKSLRKATILWMSPQNDTALISADGADVEASKISCKPVTVGEPINLPASA